MKFTLAITVTVVAKVSYVSLNLFLLLLGWIRAYILQVSVMYCT